MKLNNVLIILLLSLAFTVNCEKSNDEVMVNKNFVTFEKELIADAPTLQEGSKWKVQEITNVGIKLNLPADFTGESHSWQPTRSQKNFIIEKDKSGRSQIEIDVFASPIEGFNKSTRKQQRLETIFRLNKIALSNKKPEYYDKNGIKGFLLKDETDAEKCKLEWITYRYFMDFDPFTETDKFELWSFVLNIRGPKKDLSQIMHIIDSLEFTGKKDNFWAISK